MDASSDWDDISIENGAWSVTGLGSGAPSGAFAWGVLMHFATAGGAAVQIYFPAKVDRLYFRTRYSQAWDGWYER